MRRFRIVINEKGYARNRVDNCLVVGVDLIVIMRIIVGRDNRDGVYPKPCGMLGQIDG